MTFALGKRMVLDGEPSSPNEIPTPSSIASHPAVGDLGQDACFDLPEAGAGPGNMSSERHQRPESAHAVGFPFALKLHDLWMGARHMRRDTNSLRGVLRIVHSHVEDLRSELAGLRQELQRHHQATEIMSMEKDCEIRMLQSEAAAYRMAAEARTAALLAVEAAFHSMQKEKEEADRRIAEQAGKLQEYQLTQQEAEVDGQAREAEVQAALAILQREHAALQAEFDRAQNDAALAGQQLTEACDENARLEESLIALQEDADRLETRAVAWQQRETELMRELDRLAAENARLHADARQAETTARIGALSLARHPSLNLRERRQRSAVSPRSSSSTSHQTATDPEDLLAVEVSLLRQRNAALESEVSSAHDDKSLVAALQRENVALKAAANRSAVAADQAHADLQRVQREAQLLHVQLSHVIHSLATTGLSDSPVGPLQLGVPSEVGGTDAAELPPMAMSRVAVEAAEAHEKQETRKVPLEPAAAPETTTKTLALSRVPPASWRGPPTPKSEVPPVYSTGDVRVQRMAMGSDSSSDLVVAELRAAIASLDSRSPTDDVAAHTSFMPTDGGANEQRHGGGAIDATTGHLKSAADVLTAISHGIASLGRSEGAKAIAHASPQADATSLGDMVDGKIANPLFEDDVFN